MTIVPNDVATKTTRAYVDLDWKAETRPLHDAIDSILATNPGAISDAADNWFLCALAERDPKAAERALVALGDNPCWGDNPVYLSRSFGEGLLARMMKDEARAQAAFTKARLEQEKIVQAQPDYGPPLCVLGLIDAALGRKEEALREGRRAIELLPVEKDSTGGSQMLVYFAMIAAWAGEKDIALQYLAANAQSARRVQRCDLRRIKVDCPSGTRSAAIRASRKSSPRSRRKKLHRQQSSKVLRCLFRVASYRQIIVCYWPILARSGSFKKQDLLRAKENPSD